MFYNGFSLLFLVCLSVATMYVGFKENLKNEKVNSFFSIKILPMLFKWQNRTLSEKTKKTKKQASSHSQKTNISISLRKKQNKNLIIDINFFLLIISHFIFDKLEFIGVLSEEHIMTV